MWKKTENERETMETMGPLPASPQPQKENSIIGPSLVIKGTVSGEQDLIVQGRVEGKIELKDNVITVGKNGRVKADIYGKQVIVEGELRGNLHSDDKAIVRSSGKVRGNISAPRVTLEDGAQFKGSIDMEGAKSSTQVSTRASEEPAVTTPAKSEKPASGLKQPETSKVGQMSISSKP